MKRNLTLLFSLLFIEFFNLSAQVQIINISPPPTQLEKFQPQFIDIQLLTQSENPFNPDEIQVDMVIQDPNKQYIVVPCFFYGEQGEATLWQARFTPISVGLYCYKIRIKTSNHPLISKTFSINVAASDRNGFIHLNPSSNVSFQFDSGKRFRGIGENVSWADDYEYYFKKLNDNGCNVARIWMCPWNLYLEWDEPGLGRYHLQNAAKLDKLLKLAEKYHIYLILCFDYHGVVRHEAGYFEAENKWSDSPYNINNGGPCKTASEFFTNPKAKQFYKNRLRYIIARFGYSPNILAWEFWNEVNLTAGKRDDVLAWHKEMAAYLKQIDPYHHLVTTSFSGEGYSEMWDIADLDFSQSHHYNSPNFSELVPKIIHQHENNFHKPHIIGEFGIDFRGPAETKANDPDNIGFHNGLWSGLFSPTPIVPLTWWWDNVIDPGNLYFHFKALSQFHRDILAADSNIQPINFQPKVVIDLKNDSDNLSANLVISPTKLWGKNKVNIFVIKPTGIIKNKNSIPSFLFGRNKVEFKNPPNFKINYNNDGRFLVHVNQVSDEGHLKIYLDDVLAYEKYLPLGPPGEGEWESSEWKQEYQLWQGRYNQSYGIDVPAGEHLIRVENEGKDWMEIVAYKFINCGIGDRNNIQVLGFQQHHNIFLWLRNENYSWKKVRYNGLPTSICEAVMKIPKPAAGTYEIEWWDTYNGDISSHEIIEITDSDSIEFKIPPLQKDIACKIKKVSE